LKNNQATSSVRHHRPSNLMATRKFIAASLCFIAATTATHLHHSSLPGYTGSLTSALPKMASTSPLEIQLSPGPENSTVACSIRNTDADHTISFLTWDTPFDPVAVNTGVLTLKDAESGAEVPSPRLQIRRMMPPPRDVIFEIAPGSTAERELNLTSPWIPTDGKKYQVGVQGTWRAMWKKPAAEVTDEELSGLKGEAMPADFGSESVEMTLG
jgi:hypothetical protein